MSATRPRRRSRSSRSDVLQKPAGAFHPGVQKVGPEHFGIVSVDCAKARSKWMLADFFGNILVPPTVVEHNRLAFDETLEQLRQAIAGHELRDLLIAVERTGRYHHAPKRAFAVAGFEVRIVHPFATKQLRQPSDPGYKTDDTDLVAIHRAAVNGFALIEQPRDENATTLQLVIRHRRDLVRKSTTLCQQTREHLEVAYPGLAACFSKFWESALAWYLIRSFASPQALVAAGRDDLRRRLQQADIQYHQRTLDTVLDWAARAVSPDLAAAQHRRIALALEDDRARKTQEITALERQSAALLARTPYVLLLSFPGVNVVSAADFAGEMGPIEHYASSRGITGRAGLCPSRYQSDQVDKADGPLRKKCNRRLRAVLLGIADNLIKVNHHFNALAKKWPAAGKDARHSHVKVALRFARIAYQMVAGRQVFHHPSLQGRHYILDKLNAFHREHETPMAELMRDLQATMEQVPCSEYAAEARPLAEELEKIKAGRRHGPVALGDVLPIVLARLGVGGVESTESGEKDLR
jgi:transposase